MRNEMILVGCLNLNLIQILTYNYPSDYFADNPSNPRPLPAPFKEHSTVFHQEVLGGISGAYSCKGKFP